MTPARVASKKFNQLLTSPFPQMQDMSCGASSYMNIVLEGNIGCGKSTFLRQLELHSLAASLCSFQTEALDIWTKYGGSSKNLMEDYYFNGMKTSFAVQTAIMSGIVDQARAIPSNVQIRVRERSLESAYNVFVRMLSSQSKLSDVEFDILTALYNTLSASVMKPDLIIYFKSDPAKCLERIRQRGRFEEKKMELPYLQDIDRFYDKWLLNNDQSDDTLPSYDGMLYTIHVDDELSFNTYEVINRIDKIIFQRFGI